MSTPRVNLDALASILEDLRELGRTTGDPRLLQQADIGNTVHQTLTWCRERSSSATQDKGDATKEE